MKLNHPLIEITGLDNLWFQVGGTICNISCKHCFNSSSPVNNTFEFMTLEECSDLLEESVKYGVKEYYFTGGEPFANKAILPIIRKTLKYGPATILTNGMLIKEETAKALSEMHNQTIYTLELRVSLDGYTLQMNDSIRGKGVFDRTLRGVKLLYENGFLPIITITKTWKEKDDEEVLNGFIKTLVSHGYKRPRIKILPSLKIGQEQIRTHGYSEYEYVTMEMMNGFDSSQLLCANSRLATNKGVYVCPILMNESGAKLGCNLGESLTAFEIKYHACYTCYVYGAICSNFSSGKRDV